MRRCPSRLYPRLLTLCVAVVWLLPLPAAGQSPARFVRWAADDALALSVRAVTAAPIVLVAGGLVIPAAKPFDERISDELKESYGGAWADSLDATNEFGDPLVVIPTTSLFVLSLATRNRRFQDAAFTTLESLVAAAAITGVIKQVVGRYRPHEGVGSIRLRPFSGHSSFPSGHTTAAFAIVTPWVYYYPGPLTYGLFALSISTAVARVARDKHWPTDVIAGATVGVLAGRFLSRRHLGDRSGSPVVRPVVGPTTLGLVVRLP